MIIESSGVGRYGAEVSSEGKLFVHSSMVQWQHHSNDHGDAYSFVVAKTPTGAGDCFAFIKNNDDKDMVVTSVKLACVAADRIQVNLNDDVSTAAGGTTTTMVNRNAGSGNTADVTSESGVNITNLTGGLVVDDLLVAAGTNMQKYSWGSGLIIPKNKTISFWAVTGTAAINMTLSLYFHGTH